MKFYGKQEFRKYPLVTLEPLPDQKDMSDYYQRAANGEWLGTRIKNLDKPLICGKTAKSYKFWDNLMYHYKNLAPLYGKSVEFKEYVCPHDNWLFNQSDNLKLHNKVCKFEQAVATEIEKRVNLDNPDWVHPTTRKDARYEEDEEGQEPTPGVKKSRFLRRERKIELSYKDQDPASSKEIKPKMEFKKRETPKEEPVVEDKAAKKETAKDRRGMTIVNFPFDPEDLDPIPRPKPKNVPDYHGWTHSDEADSWFLEAHTPSLHEPFENFYDEALKKKVICPKFYACV